MRARCCFAFVIALAGGCSSNHEDHGTHQEAPAPAAPLPDVIGPPALEDENPDPNVVEVHLAATGSTMEIDGKQITMRGYNGLIPGPMLKAKVGDEVVVHFRNELVEPTTVHWHGLRIPDAMDGSPRLQEPVPPGGEFTYRFKVPEAGTYWYHPHVRANTQVESGLYAPIVIFDPAKEPEYDAQRYLLLDDILLEGGKRPAEFTQGMPERMHGRWGNTLLTNGAKADAAQATAEQGTVERWRLVNTANARTMELELEGASFRVIGTDGGLIPEPYTTKRLTLPVGKRYDLEVTYDRPGPVKLISVVQELDANDKVVEKPMQVFAVDVAASAREPRAVTWPEIVLPSRAPERTETVTINAVEGGDHGVEWQLNGKSHSTEPLFTAAQGSTITIRLENKLGPEHPFHLHGQFFTVVGDKHPGLHDTVLVPGMETVEIVAYLDNPGRWMAHCHILEHAELGMMSEIVITPKDGAPAPAAPSSGHGH